MAKTDLVLSRYLCDGFTTIAYLANTYAATLRILYDVVSQSYPDLAKRQLEGPAADAFGDGATLATVFPSPNGGAAPIFASAQFEWPDKLKRYFTYDATKRANVVELKDIHDPARDTLHFLNSVARTLSAAVISALKLSPEQVSSSPLEVFAHIDRAFQEKHAVRDALKLVRVPLARRKLRAEQTLRAAPGDGSAQAVISFSALKFGSITTKQKDDNHGVIQRVFSTLLAHIDAWLVDVLPGSQDGASDQVSHPLLPGLGIYYPSLRQGLLTPILPREDDNVARASLVSIVREARGSVTNSREDVNLIVRDLLWIRSFAKEPQAAVPIDEREYRQRASSDGDEGFLNMHGGRIGLYYSAIDGLVYEIKRIVHRDNIIMIDGVALLGVEDGERKQSKSFCMYLPKFEDSNLDFTMGTLMGGTKNNVRTGAWTVIGMKPLISDNDTMVLERKLSIYADAFELMRRESYDWQIGEIARFIEATGLVGILHSRSMRHMPNLPETADADASIEAFRTLFRTVDSYRTQCDDVLEDVVSAIMQNGEVDDAALRDQLLWLIEQQNSYAIAPVAVFKANIEDLGLDRREIRDAVQKLSRPSIGFRCYKDYEAAAQAAQE